MKGIRDSIARRLFLVIICTLSVSSFNVVAGDAEAGKKKSIVCAACHGNNGISIIPSYPNLAGQKEQYLVDSLKAYRDGLRRNMQMTPLASRLSDEDVKNLAAYYASLDPSGKNN